MVYSLRPSRFWPHITKYYFFGILFSLWYLLDFSSRMGITTVNALIEFSSGILSGFGISLNFLNQFSNFNIYFFIFGVFLILVGEIKRIRLKYNLYEDRVVKIEGLFVHHIKDISYDHVDSFYTKRSIPERILGTADLVLQTPTNKEAMILEGVGKPSKWAEYIMKRAGIWD